MKSIVVKGLTIGEGRPRIISPIVGVDEDEIVKEAMELVSNPYVEIIEWRSDKYSEYDNVEKIVAIARKLEEISKYKPIIFSLRTKSEGSNRDISEEKYSDIMMAVSNNTNIDIMDLDLLNNEHIDKCVKIAHDKGKIVIGSNHDIEKTPSIDSIVERYKKMIDKGADIAKMVVTANDAEDTLTLLSATIAAKKTIKNPVVAISMSNIGLVTRICGEAYGSCLTYGFVKKSSAGGQIPVEKLNSVLNIVHKSLGDSE